jgi:periplasmic protein TonB
MSLFDKGWIDIVFEGRNKKYGAYKLRSENPKTTIVALAVGALFFSSVIAADYFYEQSKRNVVAKPKPKEKIIEVEELMPEPEPLPDILPPPPPPVEQAAAPKSVVDEVKLTEFKAEEKEKILKNEIPDQKALQEANPSDKTEKGDPLSENLPNPDAYSGTGGTGTESKGTDEPVNYAALQVKPDFPGGLRKFYEYVNKNFRTPDLDRETTLKITVSFVVERDGSLTNIQVLKDPGHGAGKEAERVLKSLKTKWSPGMQNGKPVRANYILPIQISIRPN